MDAETSASLFNVTLSKYNSYLNHGAEHHHSSNGVSILSRLGWDPFKLCRFNCSELFEAIAQPTPHFLGCRFHLRMCFVIWLRHRVSRSRSQFTIAAILPVCLSFFYIPVIIQFCLFAWRWPPSIVTFQSCVTTFIVLSLLSSFGPPRGICSWASFVSFFILHVLHWN